MTNRASRAGIDRRIVASPPDARRTGRPTRAPPFPGMCRTVAHAVRRGQCPNGPSHPAHPERRNLHLSLEHAPGSLVTGHDLVDDEGAGVGIEGGHGPQGHGRVVLAVADRQTHQDGDPEPAEELLDDVLGRELGDVAGQLHLHIADHDPGRVGQLARVEQVGQDRVPVLGAELDLLEDHDPVLGVDLDRRPDGRRQQPGTAAGQAAAGPPAGDRPDVWVVRVVGDLAIRLGAEQGPLHGALREVGGLGGPDTHRPVRVEADRVRPGRDRQVQRGDIRVAAERLGVGRDDLAVQVADQPRAAVAALEADDAADVRVGEEGVEVGRPVFIAPGEVAMAIVDVFAETDGQPPGLEPGHGPQQLAAVLPRAGRGDEPDGIAGPESGGLVHEHPP